MSRLILMKATLGRIIEELKAKDFFADEREKS
jgi:hypothetical protein